MSIKHGQGKGNFSVLGHLYFTIIKKVPKYNLQHRYEYKNLQQKILSVLSEHVCP